MRIVGALERAGQMQARIVEGPCAAHVHRAGGTALELVGGRALTHRQLGEQFRGEHVQIDFAVVVLLIDRAGGGHRDLGIVQKDFGEVRAQTADGDIDALAGAVAQNGDTGNAVQGFGDIAVRKFADVLGEDAIAEAERVALGVDGGVFLLLKYH